MRLIDADKLMGELHESLKGDCDLRKDYEFMGIDEFIENQPTAYDVDKVVEEIINSTICQCTGLKDKNGKLIWENDIIAYWDTYSTESGLAEADCAGQVVWDDETMSFQVTNRLSAESYEVLDECSVIGNIFDNKELLESEETVWKSKKQ